VEHVLNAHPRLTGALKDLFNAAISRDPFLHTSGTLTSFLMVLVVGNPIDLQIQLNTIVDYAK
jgi:hypothetical protein